MTLISSYGDGLCGFRSEDRLSLVLSLKTKHSGMTEINDW
jgi:hypothetical protein